MAERIWADQQTWIVYSTACQAFFIVYCVAVRFSQRVVSRIAAQNQLNFRGSNLHSRMTHHEGVVSLTPNIISNRNGCW